MAFLRTFVYMNKNDVYLLLGSNLGNRAAVLHEAVQHIELQIAPLSTLSKIYETAPWGVLDQPVFLNQVVHLQTVLHPSDILKCILEIEKGMGRQRQQHWGARLIDIDLLYCGDVVLNMTNLTVPHPQLHHRRFTLVPLVELAPEFVHPVFKKNNQELLSACTDNGEVSVYEMTEGQ
jgi:2-amino-4-hydroxy-6-hydroxymethyldihydropteridine diphosphokinase